MIETLIIAGEVAVVDAPDVDAAAAADARSRQGERGDEASGPHGPDDARAR
jgi:hypothetical protein